MPTVIILEAAQPPPPFTSMETQLIYMVERQLTTDLAMAESLPPFLRKEELCELIARGLPFHLPMETAPSLSIWNTDQQSIYYCPPSLPPPAPPPITTSSESINCWVDH